MPQSEMVQRVKPMWALIEEQADAFNLRPALLAGLVCQESSGNPYAMRFEPKFRWFPRLPDGTPNIPVIRQRMPGGMSLDTELQGLKTSWGLCQVMGENLREMGFVGWWPAACQPDVALKYGAKFLSAKLATHGEDERKALLAYNGGGVAEYPDKVLAWAALFQGGKR